MRTFAPVSDMSSCTEMTTSRINFHHLHYFWMVARNGSVTGTAKQMRVAPSAVSTQIRQLEEQLGEPLFAREARRLALTEAGRVALTYADRIFAMGGELAATFERGRGTNAVLRIGAVATLSRNFQESFLKPLLAEPDVQLRLESGSLDDLLPKLASHGLDLVLSNRIPGAVAHESWRVRRIARQGVSLVGRKRRRSFRFPQDLSTASLVIPGSPSEIRSAFDALCEQLDVQPRVLAEVDDMAMIRLLARDTEAVALVPSIVVRDELRARTLHEYCVVPGLFETFYAITVERRFRHPLLRRILGRDGGEILRG